VLDIQVHSGYFEAGRFDDNSFSLITLWHALEHIPSPIEALEVAYKALKPDGVLLIALPNIASFDARVYGADWVAIDAPRHLWHFTPTTLALIASQAEFQTSGGGSLPLDAFYNVLMSEKQALVTGKSIVATPFRMGYALSGSLIKGVAASAPSGYYRLFRKNAE